MSHESTLTELYAAMNAKDIDAVTQHIADDAVFHILPNPVLPTGTLNGRQEIAAFMRQQLAGLDVTQDIDSISSEGDFATAYVVSRSRDANGAEQVVRWADVFQFTDGKISQHVSLAG
jgi:ketosteroid isomerase-like protein